MFYIEIHGRFVQGQEWSMVTQRLLSMNMVEDEEDRPWKVMAEFGSTWFTQVLILSAVLSTH